MPLVTGGWIAGGALVFLTTVKELPATLIMRPTGFDTLATELWDLTNEGFFGEAAVRDQDYVTRCRETNAEWRDWLTAQIEAAGLAVVPSKANFLLVEVGDRVAEFDDHLKTRGLIARRVEAYGLPNHIRISIGDEEACRQVADAVRGFVNA